MATELESGRVLCEQCGKDFKRIGTHWDMSKDCSYPKLSNEKKEILIGLLMGDGCIGKKNSLNQNIKVEMISPNYLKYVDTELDWLSTGVKLKLSAKESASRDVDSGFHSSANEESYSDMYRFQTRSHPFITSLTDWYDSGSKVWPEDIELTPTVLKHWYCGDGCFNNHSCKKRIQIAMANEIDNMDKVSNYFTEAGLPEPSNYNISDRGDGSKTCTAVWTNSDSKELWEYMGKPLPDFAYKWPEDLR